MRDWIALGVSILALAIAATTAWLTLLRGGELRMTRPTVLFFGPDGGSGRGGARQLKVYLRALLYSTSRKGQTIESMHVNVQRGELRQNFSIWVHGDQKLVRGSGLHVSEQGVACSHHFLLPSDGVSFKLAAGKYTVRVFGSRVNDHTPNQLFETSLVISDAQAAELANPDAGIYFDWGPDQQAYQPHIDVRKPLPLPPWLFDAAAAPPTPDR